MDHKHAEPPADVDLTGVRLTFVVNVDWFFLSHRLALARAAKAAGAEVTVVTTDTGRLAEIAVEGFDAVHLPFDRTGRALRTEATTFLRLVWYLLRHRPHLVHLVTIKPVLYGGALSRLLRLPAVLAITGAGTLFDVGQVEKRGPTRRAFERLYTFALQAPRSWVIFQNREDLAEFTERGFVAASRSSVIPGSGVDPGDQPGGRDDGSPPVVLFASRMLYQKGVVEFMEAANLLRDHARGPVFLMAGATDENPGTVSADELTRMAAACGVTWLGHRTDMSALLRQADIFCLPTYYREGVPKVLLEAGAAGCSLVTTDWPGCRDVVEHGRTGLLVTIRNVADLRAALAQLLEDPALASELGRAARDRVVDHFSEQRVLPRVLSLYAAVLRCA